MTVMTPDEPNEPGAVPTKPDTRFVSIPLLTLVDGELEPVLDAEGNPIMTEVPTQ